MTRTTISQADLAQKTQEVVDRVQHGEVAFIECAGREQVVLLDPLDFRLLSALALCATDEKQEADNPDVRALRSYFSEQISLGKAADLLNLSRFELQARLHRLGVPLRLGPATLEEARAEAAAALDFD